MDCCQLEEHIAHRAVKREDIGGGNDPENGSPDTDTGGSFMGFYHCLLFFAMKN